MVAKLTFFIEFIDEHDRILTIYQTAGPLMPMVAEDTCKLLRSILAYVLKPDCLAKLNTVKDLMNVVPEKQNYLLVSRLF